MRDREGSPAEASDRLSTEQWRQVYKAWMAEYLIHAPVKAHIGARMKEVIRNTYGVQDQRWLKFWPYRSGRNERNVAQGTIDKWFTRGSLPTNADVAVQNALRKALVEVVEAEVPSPPARVLAVAESLPDGLTFGRVVARLGAQVTDGVDTAFGAELHRGQLATVERLRRLPAGYPLHLDTVEMAGQIKLVEVDDLAEFIAGDGLYASRIPYGVHERGLEALTGERFAVVLGDPGSGKSTLLAAHCIEHITRAEGLAVFARLDDLARIAEGRTESAMRDLLTPWSAADLLVEAWDNWRQEQTPKSAREKLVDQILRSSNTLVALDGLDEVELVEGRSDLVRDILQRLTQFSPARFVVASRITGYTRPIRGTDTTVREFVVAPWDWTDARALVDRWFVDLPGPAPLSGKPAALAALEDPRIGSLARTPLVAGIICYVAEEGSVASTVFGLYRQYLNRLLRRLWRPVDEQRRTTVEVNRARVVAQQVAWTMAQSGTDVWRDSATLGWLLAPGEADAEMVLDLYYRDGILVPFGQPQDTDPLSQSVRWMHRTIHEHLVARQLAEMFLRDHDRALGVLARAAFLPAWSVSLDHLAGALDESGLLIRVVGDLWRLADDGDTPGERLRETADELLLRIGVPQDRRGTVLESRVKHHDWWAVAKIDPQALLALADGMRRDLGGVCGADDYFYAVRSLDPFPGNWDDVDRVAGRAAEFGIDPDVLDIAVRMRVDRDRAFSQLLEALHSGDATKLFIVERPQLTADEARRLVDVVAESVRTGDLLLLWGATTWTGAMPEEQSTRLRRIADEALGESAAAERWISNAEQRSFDIAAVDPAELASLLLRFGDTQMFNVGWDLAEQEVPLPEVLTEWAVLGHEMGGTNWERYRSGARGSAKNPSPEFAVEPGWRLNAEGVRATFAALKQCAQRPDRKLLASLLQWILADDPTGTPPLGAIGIDANWLATWENVIDWHMRAVIGLQVVSSPAERTYQQNKRLVEWISSAIVCGFEAGDERALGFVQQTVDQFVTPSDGDVQVSQHVAGLVRSLDRAARSDVEDVCEIVLAAAESCTHRELRTVLLDAVDGALFRAGLLTGARLSPRR